MERASKVKNRSQKKAAKKLSSFIKPTSSTQFFDLKAIKGSSDED
jgi:hypothetical protein